MVAAAVLAILVVGAALSAPFSDVVFHGSEALLPAYAAAYLINELITFALLAGLYSVEPSRGILVLAVGYLFTGLTILPWLISFPGVFVGYGIEAGLQQTATIAALRRLGFPICVLAYALLKGRPAHDGNPWRTIFFTTLATVAGVVLVAVLVEAGEGVLPPFMRDARNTAALWQIVPALALALYAAGLLVLWRRRGSVLDLWLMVVLVTLAVEVILLSQLGAGVRLSFGWWMGRLCGLVSSSAILMILLLWTTRLYARLARALVDERRARENRASAMEALSASIAHELTQPMASMLTNANAGLRWLDRDPPDLAEVRAALERIVGDGDRTGALLSNIRMVFAQRTPGPVEGGGDVDRAIEAAVARRQQDASLGRVTLEVALGDVPKVLANQVQLELVVANLLANAIDAAASVATGPRFVRIVSHRGAAGEVVVSVADNGPGLDANAKAQAFEPFFTSKPGGMGMGLMICRSIVEANGGRIWLTENRPRGAVFSFTLPHEDDTAV